MQTNSTTQVNTTASSVASPDVEIYDVVVIGAGPIGLATAIGLRQRGIDNILVIDQARAFRQVGQVIDLLPNGLKALKAIDRSAYEAVKRQGLGFAKPTQTQDEATSSAQALSSPNPSQRWFYRNLQGEPLHSISLEYEDWLKAYGEGRLSIRWYDLQTALKQQLPDNRVKANHRCVNVVSELETGSVRIDCVCDVGAETNPYAYWADSLTKDDLSQLPQAATQQWVNQSLRARLVVAADGINSTVRRVLYADSPYHEFARPEYSGFGAIGCLGISEVSQTLLSELQSQFFRQSPIVTLSNDAISEDAVCLGDPRMMLVQRPGSLGYLLHLALPLEAFSEKSGSEWIELAVQRLQQAAFPDSLQQIVRLSPLLHLLHRPYYIHRATLSGLLRLPSTAQLQSEKDAEMIQPAWSAGRVVLAGDAAHGMPPFMAQGANQGLEDAFTIATLIAQIQNQQAWNDPQAITQAFEHYEQIRRPVVARVQKATLERFDRCSAARQEYNELVYSRNFDSVW